MTIDGSQVLEKSQIFEKAQQKDIEERRLKCEPIRL